MPRHPRTPAKDVDMSINVSSFDDMPNYETFIKRFGRADLKDETNVKLLGYEKTIKILKDKIESLLNPATRGQEFALITGPSGTGKTTVVRQLAREYAGTDKENPKLRFFYLKASWTLERQFGNPETNVRNLFDEADLTEELCNQSSSKYQQNHTPKQQSNNTPKQQSNQQTPRQQSTEQYHTKPLPPSLIFIDKIDLICAEKRHQNDSKDRVFNVLEDKLEALNNKGSRVLVLAATDRPEVLDPQIRKPCYFGEEIRFSLPSKEDRRDALKFKLETLEKNLTSQQIEEIADGTHCYTYPDLDKLINKALRHCQDASKGTLTFSSLKWALSQFKPVTIKTITTPCPPLRWKDIGGVESAKRELLESVIWPLDHRDKFQKLGIISNKGALLYGPPGCSKTMLAQALATESGYNFISVKGPELFSKWVGDSEAAVRKLYRNAREIAPCLIFFDEIDGFAPERSDSQSSSVGDKVVAQLLTELNGIEPLDNVFTIAATNRPDRVDSALLRPGRLDPAIYIPLPNSKDRAEIFRVHMSPLSLKFEEKTLDEVINELVTRTEVYSGAEIANVCRVAGTLALRESLKNEHIEWHHFEQALEKVRPRTRADQLKSYENFQQRTLQSTNKKRMRFPKSIGKYFGHRYSNNNENRSRAP